MNERYAPTICPICNKEFRPEYYAQWGWLIGTERSPEPVCSYHCQRKWEKTPKIKKKYTPRKRTVPVRIVETGGVFDSAKNCAEYLHISLACIYRSINTIQRATDFTSKGWW